MTDFEILQYAFRIEHPESAYADKIQPTDYWPRVVLRALSLVGCDKDILDHMVEDAKTEWSERHRVMVQDILAGLKPGALMRTSPKITGIDLSKLEFDL